MMLGLIQDAAASSSHRNSSSAQSPMYLAAGVPALAICLIMDSVMWVLTEMSTVVTVIFFQGARSVMWTASGSNQKLNSRRLAWVQVMGAIGAMLPPITTSSCASSAK